MSNGYLPAFKKLNHPDPLVNKIQDNVGLKTSQLDALPFSSGIILEAQVTTTATEFDHKLGRTPIGWLIMDKDANADVWRAAPFNDKTITLDASGTVNVKLWVF